MPYSKEHALRVNAELKQAGLGRFSRMQFASHYLPRLIHEDEHIEAAVSGRYKEARSLFALEAGMLVATNKRVIFLDHKPGFTNFQELGYDVISGIKAVTTGPFTAITLQTKIGDFKLSYTRLDCVECFVGSIEQHRIENMPKN